MFANGGTLQENNRNTCNVTPHVVRFRPAATDQYLCMSGHDGSCHLMTLRRSHSVTKGNGTGIRGNALFNVAPFYV